MKNKKPSVLYNTGVLHSSYKTLAMDVLNILNKPLILKPKTLEHMFNYFL